MSFSLQLPTKVKAFDLAAGLASPIPNTVLGEFSSTRELHKVDLAGDSTLTLSLGSTAELLA